MKRMIKMTIAVSLVAMTMGMAFAAVTEKEAVDIALSDAGITREEAAWLNSHPDRDDGRLLYDVEFRSDEGKWEYSIDSESGRIVGFDYEEVRRTPSASGSVDRAGAENIALRDANLSENDVSRLRTEMDRDHGLVVYEIEFNSDDSEYEYEINGNDGVILKASWSLRGRISGDRDARLSDAEVENIAMDILGEDVERLSVWEDFDDGRYWYEAKAIIGDYAYEIDISGTGVVASVSREYLDYRN